MESDGKARILEAAGWLFAQKGFDAASIQQIADAAGVSKATIFHHFPSKRELYIAVVREACRDSYELLASLKDAQGSVFDRLILFAKHHLANLMRHQDLARLVLREIISGNQGHAKHLATEVFGEHFEHLVDMVREGQVKNEIRQTIDPAMAAILLIAANVFYFQARGVLGHLEAVDFATDEERFVKKASEILMHGMAEGGGRC